MAVLICNFSETDDVVILFIVLVGHLYIFFCEVTKYCADSLLGCLSLYY